MRSIYLLIFLLTIGLVVAQDVPPAPPSLGDPIEQPPAIGDSTSPPPSMGGTERTTPFLPTPGSDGSGSSGRSGGAPWSGGGYINTSNQTNQTTAQPTTQPTQPTQPPTQPVRTEPFLPVPSLGNQPAEEDSNLLLWILLIFGIVLILGAAGFGAWYYLSHRETKSTFPGSAPAGQFYEPHQTVQPVTSQMIEVQKVKNYIQQTMQMGATPKQIKQNLKSVGWKDETIDEAFMEYYRNPFA